MQVSLAENWFWKDPLPDLLLAYVFVYNDIQCLHHVDGSVQEMHAGIEITAEHLLCSFHLMASPTDASVCMRS